MGVCEAALVLPLLFSPGGWRLRAGRLRYGPPGGAASRRPAAVQKKTPLEAGCRSLACVWRSVVLVVIRSMRTVSDEPSGYIPDLYVLISAIPWRFPLGLFALLRIDEQHSCQEDVERPAALIPSRVVDLTVTHCTLLGSPRRPHRCPDARSGTLARGVSEHQTGECQDNRRIHEHAL
jgi:hypothetical protein